MKISAAELRKRMEQGEDLEAISLSLISPAERDLLKCCAVVRTFDEKLVDTYFRPQVPGADKQNIPFKALTIHDFVQRVPRTDDVYFLLPATRKQYYDSWWEPSDGNAPISRSEVPEPLRELSRSLIEHYSNLGDAGKLDLLAQQVFVDKEKTCDLFEELYTAADDAFDLARCRDIINVLTGRENVLGPTLAQTLNDTNRYLQARSMWATEYYQTVNYYERKELTADLESFLASNARPDPGNKWILHLHAPGGMGKTMFVRWLISRRGVPKPYTIPCGRVDFDFVDRITASQHRWRLFLDIARDLEVQIPGNYFHSLITRFSEYERILNHQETQQASSSQLPPRDKLEEEMLYLFGNALRDAKLEKPILLIFDTLEEVILYHPEDLLEIVRQVNKLRQANVLVILSGRYDLTATDPDEIQRLPQFNDEFGAVTQTIRVKPFAKEEALGFLQLRGLTEDRPLELVVERSEGNPFKLALFADLLLDDPEITADTIRSYPSTDLLYLIERVLARIPNRTLHWLLRYGVVPRKLTLSFVKDVIKPHLERAISGDPSHDDPSRYESLTPKARATVQEKEIFAKNIVDSHGQDLEDEELDKLWTELQNYASTFAWVTMERGDPHTASFHGDVVNPMRRWLEENPVYKLLHQDAIQYFEKKAQSDPNDWAKWMSNAVYHKFQLEGDQAARYWHWLISDEEDPSRRRELAGEIIGSEYVDENFNPRLLLNGQKIIDLTTLAEAYYERARACVGMARAQNVPASDQLWFDADYDLAKCEELLSETSRPLVSHTKLIPVRAAILISQGHNEKAISIIQDALKQTLKESELLRLETELANAYAAHENNEKAIFYWESALQRAERIGRSPRFIVETRRRLARLHRDAHDLYNSALDLEKALEFLPQDDATTRAELLRVLGDLYLEMGAFSRAQKTFADARGGDPYALANLQFLNQMTRFFLASKQPDRALEIREQTKTAIAKFDRSQVTDESMARFNKMVAQFEEQSGMLKSMLREVEPARIDLETARSRWRELGDSEATKRCMLKKVDLFLTQAGDVNQAVTVLHEATRLTLNYSREQWLEEQLLQIRIWHLTQAVDLYAADLQRLEQNVGEEWAPTLRARMILGTGSRKLLPNDRKAVNQFFSDLADVLSQIEPASARMMLLDPLSEYPSCKEVDYEVVEKVLGLFPLKQSDDDFAMHAPRLAELLRVLGRKDQAVSLLKHLIENDLKSESFALRGALLARARVSPREQNFPELMKFFKKFLDDYKSFSVLCGSTLVEFAEHLFTGRRSVSNRLVQVLDQAEKLLKADSNESQWTARLFALRGRLTIKDPRKEAREQLERAMRINQKLGNRLAAENLERFIATQPRPITRRGGALRERMFREPEFETTEQERQLDQRPPKTTIIVESWTDTFTIKTILPGESEPITRRVPIEAPSLLDDLLAFETYENYSFSFLRQMDSDWIATCDGVGRILMDEKQVQKLQEFEGEDKQKPDLRLIMNALQLSSTPWELMVLPSQPAGPASVSSVVNCFYRSVAQESATDMLWLQVALSQLSNLGTQSLADGIHGKRTEESIRQFQRDHGLPDHGHLDGRTRRMIKRALHVKAGWHRPRVLLLRPGIESQRGTSRGQQVYGFDLDDLYRGVEFKELVVIEDPYLELVEEALSDFKPSVVHICPTMEESPSVGIYLDFGSGGTGVMPRRSSAKGSSFKSSAAPRGDVQFLTLTAVAELMGRQLKQDRARPLLILDVLQPAGQTELFTQLFLRNAFAAQLYQTGAFESIIATGLTPPELQEEMSRALIRGIGWFEAIGDTVNRLRRMRDSGSYTHLPPPGLNLGPLRDPSDRKYLSDVVATAGIALFTQDPEM